MPRSLVGRMTGIVVLLGLLGLGLHLGLLALWIGPLLTEQQASLADRVRLERNWLEATPPADRAALARRLSGPEHRVMSVDALALDAPDGPPPMRPLPASMRERMPPAMEVHLVERPGAEAPMLMWFEFLVDGQRWRVEHAVPSPTMQLLGSGAGWLALGALSVVASLALGVRLVGAPLQRLAGQIAEQRGGLRRLVPGPRASTEVLTVVDSFNRLVEAVQRADAVKQQMLAGVSHDLRTPLARLRLRIETQCETPTAEALGADLEAVERIVSQFLAYVQGDSAGALGHATSLADVVSHVVASYAADGRPVSTGRSDVMLEVADLPAQRALSNLIDNALAHGEPPVEVVLSRRWSSAGETVVLAVYDRGGGMNDADFQRAQQPFVRLAGASAELGHCGLGLAIVAQMARQLGATLRRLPHDGRGRFGIALEWPDPGPRPG